MIEKRKTVHRVPHEEASSDFFDVELNQGIHFETKHKEWFERRRFIFNFFLFLGIAVLLVIGSVAFTKRKDTKLSAALSETIHNGNELLLNVEKKISDKIHSLNSNNDSQNSYTGDLAVIAVSEPKLDDTKELETKCNTLIEEIRSLKQSDVVISNNAEAQFKIHEVQQLLRKLVPQLYGPEPYVVEMSLKFPESMPDYVSNGGDGQIFFEMAPLALAPYSTYYFLDVVSHWQGGNFHRNAGHVLQAMVKHNSKRGLAWQEYNAEFPHKRLTMGYAGRPGGPEFYISTVDNTSNHGPGSQGSDTEADSCFAKILPTPENQAVIKRMMKQPGKTPPNGFIGDPKNYIEIMSLKIVSNKSSGNSNNNS